MPEETVFRGIIVFLEKIGVYDVILPFVLVFTIMFAILEKTKVLGTEGDKGQYSKKSLNSMVAFVVAFFVIASAKLVSLINEALGNVVILVLVSLSFLMLAGMFIHDPQEWLKNQGSVVTTIIVILALGVILIFMHAIPLGNTNVLSYVLDFIAYNWQSDWVGAIILVVVVIAFMAFVTGEKKMPKEDDS